MKTYIMAGSKRSGSTIRSSEMFGYSSLEIIGKKLISHFMEQKRVGKMSYSLEEWISKRMEAKFYSFDIDSGESARNISKPNFWRLLRKDPTLQSDIAHAMLLK
jgi:hypothetical protein